MSVSRAGYMREYRATQAGQERVQKDREMRKAKDRAYRALAAKFPIIFKELLAIEVEKVRNGG